MRVQQVAFAVLFGGAVDPVNRLDALLDVPEGVCYWSVRAIDGGLLASDWSEEQMYPHYISWPQEVTDVAQGDIQWADFDGDGDLDLAICGDPDYFDYFKTYILSIISKFLSRITKSNN